MATKYRETAYKKIENNLNQEKIECNVKLEKLEEELEYNYIVKEYVNIFSGGYQMSLREEDEIKRDIDQVNKDINKIDKIIKHLKLNETTILE